MQAKQKFKLSFRSLMTSLVMLNGLASTGGDIVANIIREFVLKGITSHIPTDAQPQSVLPDSFLRSKN